jgi:hypothetical protein
MMRLRMHSIHAVGGIFDDEEAALSSQEPLSTQQARDWGHASSGGLSTSQWGVVGTPMTPQSPQRQHQHAPGSSQRGSTPSLSQSQRFGTPQSQHALPRGDLGHHFRSYQTNTNTSGGGIGAVPGTPSSIPGTPM